MGGMDLLVAFLLGALVAAALAVWLWRTAKDTADPALADLQDAIHRLEVGQAGLSSIGAQMTDIGRQTSSLAQALSRPGVRGAWGEITLVNVCEAAGMTKHIDFETQRYLAATADAGAARPDVVINLPGGGHVCVDAKLPWDGMRDAGEGVSPAERRDAMARHVNQVRGHVRGLASRGYWERFAQAPEMVVMFIASEAAFAAAVHADPGLIEKAARDKVVIASPTTMLALLQVVALGWRQSELSENAEAIRGLATDLVRRMSKLTEHMTNVSKGLERAAQAQNQAVSSYEGRLLVTARRLGELGIGEAEALGSPPQVETAVRVPADSALDAPAIRASDAR